MDTIHFLVSEQTQVPFPPFFPRHLPSLIFMIRRNSLVLGSDSGDNYGEFFEGHGIQYFARV